LKSITQDLRANGIQACGNQRENDVIVNSLLHSAKAFIAAPASKKNLHQVATATGMKQEILHSNFLPSLEKYHVSACIFWHLPVNFDNIRR